MVFNNSKKRDYKKIIGMLIKNIHKIMLWKYFIKIKILILPHKPDVI
jgi:hypothetical protein